MTESLKLKSNFKTLFKRDTQKEKEHFPGLSENLVIEKHNISQITGSYDSLFQIWHYILFSKFQGSTSTETLVRLAKLYFDQNLTSPKTVLRPVLLDQ